jgi:hypothetical protein
MRTNRKLVLVLLAAMSFAGNSCSLAEGKGIAEAAVVQFHSQY